MNRTDAMKSMLEGKVVEADADSAFNIWENNRG